MRRWVHRAVVIATELSESLAAAVVHPSRAHLADQSV